MRREKFSSKLMVAARQKKQERDYWLKKLSGEWVKTTLAYDYKNPGEKKPDVEKVTFRYTHDLFLRLMKLSNRSEVKLHIVLVSLSVTFLNKYTYAGNRDIIVGTPIYKQEMKGEFINTVLPLRIRIDDNITFKELLFQVRETIVEAAEHQSYPMEILLAELNMPFSQAGFPLFEIAVLLENIQDRAHIRHTTPNITFSFLRTDRFIEGSLEYNARLYSKATIKRMISHFNYLAREAVFNVDAELHDIDILSGDEKKQVLLDFNNDKVEYPKDKTCHRLFEEQVETIPDYTALVFEDKYLTYRTLNEKANQLANLLRTKGVKPDSVAGLLVNRSLEMVVGILGILKAGGAYLPLDPDYPGERITYILEESQAAVLLTTTGIVEKYSYTALQNLPLTGVKPYLTGRRPQIMDLDRLPFPNRSLVNYEKYHRYIGVAPVKHGISLLATRGCPFNCAYCHKIWPKKHAVRSAENIFAEVQLYYNLGIRRFTIIDDIFNLNVENSSQFFRLIIQTGLEVQLFFPNGLRGDLLTREYIDLMVEAGTVGIAVALESASPRLQKLIKKNLDLEKLRENIDYICTKYPHVVLELQTMVGFPTETEKEAMLTLDFIKNLKWLHFPYLHILKIYQNTDMSRLAVDNGVSMEAIAKSQNLAYHELPETLPFSKNFMLTFQSRFLNEYFLAKERLLHVLPYQMKLRSEDEMVQKYDSYLPVDIHSFDDLLQFFGITRVELGTDTSPAEKRMGISNLNEKIRNCFPVKKADEEALNVLLLDLSQYFSGTTGMLYEVIEAPLGLMYLMTYLQQELGSKIAGKIARSRIDFDNYGELKGLIAEFKPDVIGMRTLTLYKDFFHKTAAMIRQWGIKVPIIAGGPYATGDYETILQDRNIDLVVLGEGEITFLEIIGKIIENNGELPAEEDLKKIPGITFAAGKENASKRLVREILLLDESDEILSKESRENLSCINKSTDLAYTLFTSGSTGKPKGAMVEHRSINNLVAGLKERIYRRYGENQRQKVGLVAPYVFDASVQQVFAALLQGHSLYIVPEDDRVDGGRLLKFYQKQKLDMSDGTPTHIRLLVGSTEKGSLEINMRHLIIGGEALAPPLVESFFNRFRGAPPKITNVYGLTECCVDSTSYEITPENVNRFDTIPIGKPMPNQQIYILSKDNRLQPPGVPGELCIAGDNLGRGYLKREALTAEKFAANPFAPGRRMYKTGDLARWLPNDAADIEFLGRIDHQVKIRGFRIELGEIETQLMDYKKYKHLKYLGNENLNQADVYDLENESRCSKCLLTAGYPGIRFDKQGICNYCHEYERYGEKAKRYFKSIPDFKRLIEKARKTRPGGSEYDCLLLFSGGKDSSYVLYRLVELGLKVLTFTFDNGYISETAFQNIERTTSRLGVDSIISQAEKMGNIFVDSLNHDHTVCSGCFKALTTLSTELADKKGINVVITGLSRGQIFDAKLHALFHQGIFDIEEIEKKLLLFRKIYHSVNDRTSRILNVEFKDEVFDGIHFVDFFRYEEAAVEQIREYLRSKDAYWTQPKDTGFCSSNCMINDVGIYVHQLNRGYHNYAAPLSWDCRLALMSREDGLKEVKFEVDMERVERILNSIGYFADRVNDAVVIAQEDETGEKSLCAYIVSDSELEVSELKEYLGRNLPAYMIPAYFVQLEKIPLTRSGKVDRKALPDPTSGLALKGVEYVKPGNEVEEKLAEMWSEVLGIEKDIISIDSSFFELGGHSLKASILVSKIQKIVNAEISLKEIFKNPTIRGLAGYLKEAARGDYISIEPAAKKEYYVLSSAQERLYILQQLDKTGIAYNIPSVVILAGDVNRNRLEDTFHGLIKRHESLRTSFVLMDQQPVQKIHEEVEFEIEYYDLATESTEDTEKGEQKTEEILQEKKLPTANCLLPTDFVCPFDLSQAPLMRVRLVNAEAGKYVLMIDMHHIVSDGISAEIFVREFMALYAGETLPESKLQYKDFAQWENQEKNKGSLLKQETFWKNEFENEIPILDLPTDYTRPAVQSYEGDTSAFEISYRETGELKSLAIEEGVTLYMVLLALYGVLLARLTNREDIVIGTPVAGRTHADLEPVIGVFINTLALRSRPSYDKSFKKYLEEISKKVLDAFDNQQYPFEDLIEQVAAHRDLSRNPLFDTMFLLQDMDLMEIEIPGIVLNEYKYETGTSKFDLTLKGLGREKNVVFLFEYSTKLFKKATIEQFIVYFKNVISAVVSNPAGKISEIEIISEKEKEQLLIDFNRTEMKYPGAKTFIELFDDQVKRIPDNNAVVFAENCITYGELSAGSNRLAGILRKKGAEPGSIVAIKVERSLEMLAGIWGILKAGCAYLPIDPDYPQERIDFMLKDSNARVLLSEVSKVSKVSGGTEVMDLPLLVVETEDAEPTHLTHLTHPTQLCYIIYTSGSTGKPKGVMIEHSSVLNILYALQKEYPLTETDAYLLKTSYVFDVSVTELFGWFWEGGKLVILGPGGEIEPEKILDTIERQRITHVNFVPSMFNVFVGFLTPQNSGKLSGLRWFFLAGEALLPELVERFNRLDIGIRLENIYGPTEATIYASKYSLDEWDEGDRVPIGTPLPNMKLYILDKSGCLQPVGAAGELCISGAGIARGYLNNPELTAEKFCLRQPGGSFCKNRPLDPRKNFSCGGFLTNDQWPMTNDRLYRTGDLARWLPDGNIEFLGRKDRQVKIRGFRIELGEIENHLLTYDGIKEAVVLEKEDGRGNTYLCAYFLANKEETTEELQNYLSHRLPGYMIPSYFVQVGAIPLTPSGKLDRSALPSPVIAPGTAYAAPRNETEEKLVEIWWEVLLVRSGLNTSPAHTSISIADNFFVLGGNSLNAIIMISKLHSVFEVKIPLVEFFKTPTIMGLAEYVKKSVKNKYTSIEPVEKKEYYALSSAQKRLYALQHLDRQGTTYNMPSLAVLAGELDTDRVEETFKRLIKRHESLRTSFKVIGEEPMQVIGDGAGAPLVMMFHEHEAEVVKNFVQPFDLEKAPLLKGGLIKTGEKKYILMIDMHHIISDGTSKAVLVREMMSVYAGEQLGNLKLYYKDYSEWQNRQRGNEKMQKQEKYWLKQFAGEIPVLNLPTDYDRQQVQDFAGDTVDFKIGIQELEKLKELASAERATLYMVLLAVCYIMLSKLSGQEDIVIGSLVEGRSQSELRQVTGMFVNTLAIRNYPKGEKTFAAFLREVKERTLEAIENQEYQFEDLAEKVSSRREMSRNPLFDIIFTFQDVDIPGTKIPGLKLVHKEYEHPTSKFDMTIIGRESRDELVFTLRYRTKLFKRKTIERYIGYFKEVMASVLENKDIRLKEIAVIHDLARAESSEVETDFVF